MDEGEPNRYSKKINYLTDFRIYWLEIIDDRISPHFAERGSFIFWKILLLSDAIFFLDLTARNN